MLRRFTWLRRWTPIAPRNAERVERNWRRAYESLARVLWVKRQPCVICGRTPSDNAHISNGGRSRKADSTEIAPLCGPDFRANALGHHGELDEMHREAFEARYGVDLGVIAAETEAKWRAIAGPVA